MTGSALTLTPHLCDASKGYGEWWAGPYVS